MITASLRQVVAPAIICLCLVVGVHMFVVKPMKDRLQQSLATPDSAVVVKTNASHAGMTLEELEFEHQYANHHLDNIRDAGRLVHDEGFLFQKISELGAFSEVSIERLDPQTRVHNPADKTGTTSLRCSIEATGTYGAIAVFVKALDEQLGITFVRSLHIAPVQGYDEELILASIETEHFSIDPRRALASGEQR